MLKPTLSSLLLFAALCGTCARASDLDCVRKPSLAVICSGLLSDQNGRTELKAKAAELARTRLSPESGAGWGLLPTGPGRVFPEWFASCLFDAVDNPAGLSSHDIPLEMGSKPYGTLSVDDGDRFRLLASALTEGLNEGMTGWGEKLELMRIDLRKSIVAAKLPGQGFHIDEGYATLLVTFEGPGTELAVKDGEGVRRFTVEPFDILFVSGKLRAAAFPGKPGALGTVHRAPKIGARRLVLVIHLQPVGGSLD